MRHWRSYVIKSFYPEITWEKESLTVHSPVCMEQTDAGGNAEGRIWCAVFCVAAAPIAILLYIHFVKLNYKGQHTCENDKTRFYLYICSCVVLLVYHFYSFALSTEQT